MHRSGQFIRLFPRFFGCIVLLAATPPAGRAAESDARYGPRLEIGGGAGLTSESTRLSWGSKTYQLGIITGAYRLFKGFAIQGGLDYGRGSKPEDKTLPYGKLNLNLNGRTYTSSHWMGGRYELPLAVIGKDILGMHSLTVGAGWIWTDYGVKSSSWTNNGDFEESEHGVQYRTANFRAPYATAAGRWRFDMPETEGIGSWIGSVGVDFGVRYLKYRAVRMEYPTIDRPPDNYHAVQFFLLAFMKLSVFD